MKNEIISVFELYADSLSKGDFKTTFETISDDIVWHMGGNSPLSGVVKGKKELEERLAEFGRKSNGTFRVVTNWYASNDCFVAASVVSVAEKSEGNKLNMEGVDIFKIENGKIQEVWTFAKNQELEDEYWR
ncbi:MULTISPECIES: nuclear transport factor 2 family protein [Streptococcus]|uniref:nuclear transport factor 2 family protein n=1 Tax=Streptococcus TaxID=1301 RepID=UPI000232991F|nr:MULTISPECIES: nuclear transport factor 2 family protein [Streptococcus]EHG12185.1 hypothetical protein HMPREF9177_01183 [Streptococcus intermedius F0413]QKH77073.1 nuclear transport factor 2 family protein [Streptococcus intermedius]